MTPPDGAESKILKLKLNVKKRAFISRKVEIHSFLVYDKPLFSLPLSSGMVTAFEPVNTIFIT